MSIPTGALLQNHKVFISNGHDEYWAAGERQSVEAARNAGVNLAFFSGNELFWKTRWASSSADGTSTPYRTEVDYKDTHFDAPVDPSYPPVTTPTWRDPRFSPPGDAGRPENSLSGQIFSVNAGTSDIKVPSTFSKLRFWRNTAVSTLTSGQTLTLGAGTGTLGYEWDVDPDNGFRPAGRIPMSSTTVSGLQTFTDYGTGVADNTTASHSLSLYRAPSGALVFGAGTVQWGWGLDITNAWNSGATNPNATHTDANMQQATVNLMADMGAQPATLQSGLIATPKSDTTAPTATVSSPSSGPSLTDGNTSPSPAPHPMPAGGTSPRSRSPRTGARPGTRPSGPAPGPTRGTSTAAPRPRSRPGRSTTRATSAPPPRARRSPSTAPARSSAAPSPGPRTPVTPARSRSG